MEDSRLARACGRDRSACSRIRTTRARRDRRAAGAGAGRRRRGPRAERALRKVEGGYALTRDPDHRNTQSQAPGAPLPRLRDLDVWQSLAQVSCPVTFVRGRLSDRNKPEYYDRIARDFPHCRIETVEARHDIAHEAPADLIALLGRIVR